MEMTARLDRSDPVDTAAPKPREHEILDSIRGLFAEKGFDGASMQELARAAGMSVGNFYRYFPSKAAMVEAIVRRELAEVEVQVALLAQSDDPLEMMRAALHERILQEGEGCADAPLWAEISAAALRKPEVAAIVAGMECDIARYLTNAFALATSLPEAEAAARFTGHAQMAVMLVKTTGMQARNGLIAGAAPRSDELVKLVLRMLDTLLDEVAEAKVKG